MIYCLNVLIRMKPNYLRLTSLRRKLFLRYVIQHCLLPFIIDFYEIKMTSFLIQSFQIKSQTKQLMNYIILKQIMMDLIYFNTNYLLRCCTYLIVIVFFIRENTGTPHFTTRFLTTDLVAK